MTKRDRAKMIERQKIEAESFAAMEQLARERGALVAQLQAQLANQTRTITNLERQNEHLRSVACRATAPDRYEFRLLVHVERVNVVTSEFEVTQEEKILGVFHADQTAKDMMKELADYAKSAGWC